MDIDIARAAVAGWRRFGKGRHPAELDFGGCFFSVIANPAGVPTQCKGDDFTETDIAAAIID